MYYASNKANSRTINKEPTLTDQSQAHETDINVIVGRFATSGRVPGTQRPPMSGDFSELPNDLRGFLDTARTTKDLQKKLPKELQGKSIEEILRLSPDELQTILTPVEANKPTEEKPK